MKFSAEQEAFIAWAGTGTGSCVLEAVAGAGKTTTLLVAGCKMNGTVAILAYNKAIALEIQDKIAKMKNEQVPGSDKLQAGTVHSFGFAAYRNAYKRSNPKSQVKVEGKKVNNIVELILEDQFKAYAGMIIKLVSFAKQRGLGIMGSINDVSQWRDIANHFDVFDTEDEEELPEDEIIAQAITVLKASNNQKDVIDFDDMVYLPVLLKMNFFRFDNVMVDEAQDTNPARRALVRALVKKGGRVVAVGDRHQAIFGFTGADSDSLDLIADDFNCIRLPLTTTYRCPKKVVTFAQRWVSHIKSAETSPEGEVSSTTTLEFLKRNDLNGTAAVLCRNTKPLIALALRLIRNKIACKVEGRDVGEGLKKLARRWKIKTTDKLREKLELYLERETTKLLAKKQESKLQIVEDTVETLYVIIDACESEGKNQIFDVIAYIDSLFADDVKGILVLSTIHKSKGREWETVFWLDRAGTCPSKYARQEWQKEQEANLCYVAATRAKSHLVELAIA